MLATVSRNRAIYDVLVLLLSYPEKRASSLDNVVPMNVDEDSSSEQPSDSELEESYNVRCRAACRLDFPGGASQTHRAAAPFAFDSVDDRRDFVALRGTLHA